MTTTTTLSEALAKAQAEMANAKLDAINPHFRSKYATLASVRDAVIPALAKNGIACTQTMIAEPGMTVLRTSLMKGDEAIHSDFPIMVDLSNPQKVGSYLTYARRYSLAAIGCISADEDDDGNAATPQKGSATATTAAPAQMKRMPAEQAEEAAKRLVSQIRTTTTHEELDKETRAAGFKRDLNELSTQWPEYAKRVTDEGKAHRQKLVEASNKENFPVG